jgi:hypothetical protein
LLKSLRIGLPLFSSLLLLIQGIRSDIKKVWKVFLLAVSFSSILSIISVFVTIPIYYNEQSGNILMEHGGRLINSNASFGIIGLYLLFSDKNKWYNKGNLPLFTSILSIVTLVLTFNRTYLALLFIGFIYLSFKTFSLKNALKIILLPLIGLGTVYTAYDTFPAIEHQVDKRILSIINQKTTITQSTIENNRDIIYDGVVKRIDEGYWLWGLPIEKPIFSWGKKLNDVGYLVTDTSFINVLLRYGIAALLFLVFIYYKLFKLSENNFYKFCFIIFAFASLNIDSLFRQNSVFFLVIIFMISNQVNKHIYKKEF